MKSAPLTHLEALAAEALPKSRRTLLDLIAEENAYRNGEQNDRPDDYRVNDLTDRGLENLRAALAKAENA